MFQRITPETVYSIAQHTGRRYGRTPDDREELAGVAALALCEGCERIERADNPTGLAYKIARDAAVSALRHATPTLPLSWAEAAARPTDDPQAWVPTKVDVTNLLLQAPRSAQRAVVKRMRGEPLRGKERLALHRLRAA